MATHIIHELLFNLVSPNNLIFEATCWRHDDKEKERLIDQPRRKSLSGRYNNNEKFKKADHVAVDLVLRLIDALEVPNAIAKNTECKEARKTNHITSFVPKTLMSHWMDLWAKNSQWKRYEAALISTGFIINEGSRDLFEKVMFKNKRYVDGEFTPDHFPLFQKFQDNYRLLTNSGLFQSTYEGDYRQKASSLEIVKWFESMEIDLPKGLAERVKKYQSKNALNSLPQPDEPDTPLSAKERSSMLTLIHAMAGGKFQYREGESLGAPKKKIYLAIQNAGLSMNERTIGDYLKKAQKEADRLKDKKQ